MSSVETDSCALRDAGQRTKVLDEQMSNEVEQLIRGMDAQLFEQVHGGRELAVLSILHQLLYIDAI